MFLLNCLLDRVNYVTLAGLAVNSQKCTCLWLLSTGIKGVCHYTQVFFLILKCVMNLNAYLLK